MPEYKQEAFEMASQDVGCEWLIVGVMLSAKLLVPVVLQANATTLTLLARHLLDAL